MLGTTNIPFIVPKSLTVTLNGSGGFVYDGTSAKSLNITAASIGAAASSHTHTKSQITDFPTSFKNPTSITIKLNGGATEGTDKFTYDGSTAKSVNITAESLGITNTGSVLKGQRIDLLSDMNDYGTRISISPPTNNNIYMTVYKNREIISELTLSQYGMSYSYKDWDATERVTRKVLFNTNIGFYKDASISNSFISLSVYRFGPIVTLRIGCPITALNANTDYKIQLPSYCHTNTPIVGTFALTNDLTNIVSYVVAYNDSLTLRFSKNATTTYKSEEVCIHYNITSEYRNIEN